MRRLLIPLLLAIQTGGFFLAGVLFADPLGALHRVQELRLRWAGATLFTFPGPDGRLLRTWELGPRSAAVPVILLHGLGASADYWTGTALALRAAGRTVFLPDAPGSGGSQSPVTLDGYAPVARVAAVDALFRALALEKADLVGHSLGGWTAGAFAIAFPWRVRRLVLVNGAGLSAYSPEAAREAKARMSPARREGRRLLYDMLFVRKPVPAFGFVVDAVGRNYTAENVVETLARLGPSDALVSRVASLPAGTAFVWGEHDQICPIDGARAAVALVPGGRMFVVTGVGHDTPIEAARLFQETLLKLLSPPEEQAR